MSEPQKRGSPGIRRTTAGTYEARYRDPTGRQRQRTFKRKTDAAIFLSGIQTTIRRGEWTDPTLGRTAYEAWATRWMAANTHLRPKTIAGYQSLLRSLVLPTFGQLRLASIEPIQVREWVSEMTERRLSSSRIRQAYQLLSASLQAAAECGYLGRTPCVGVKLPKQASREMLFLSAEQVQSLAAAIAEPYGALIRFTAYTGLRFGEVTALRIGKLDVLGARVRVAAAYSDVAGTLHLGPPKSGKERTVTVPRSVCEEVAAALAGRGADELVFRSPEGGPLRQGNFYHRQFKPAVERAGLDPDFRFHDLRHTCAALLIAKGAHPRAIMEHLGHSSISVTMDRYGHLFPDEKDRLANSLDEAARSAKASQDVGFMWGSGGGSVVPFKQSNKKSASDQDF